MLSKPHQPTLLTTSMITSFIFRVKKRWAKILPRHTASTLELKGDDGRTPGPGLRKCTRHLRPCPSVLPLALRLREGLGRMLHLRLMTEGDLNTMWRGWRLAPQYISTGTDLRSNVNESGLKACTYDLPSSLSLSSVWQNHSLQ